MEDERKDRRKKWPSSREGIDFHLELLGEDDLPPELIEELRRRAKQRREQKEEG